MNPEPTDLTLDSIRDRVIAATREARSAAPDVDVPEVETFRAHAVMDVLVLLGIVDGQSKRVTELEALVAAVRAIHTEGIAEGSGWCCECALSWPCQTIRALGGGPLPDPAAERRCVHCRLPIRDTDIEAGRKPGSDSWYCGACS